MNAAKVLLKKYWGHNEFRESQEDIIRSVLSNQNTIAVLPTGAGKSICFQIPGLLKEGVCVVISPLISLMENQVNSLQEKGIKAIALTSKYSTNAIIQEFDNLRFGNYKFLYLSPEKLQSEFIQDKLSQLKINLIAIDEAHCISQWGHDFRPSYLKINTLKKIHPEAKIIALTATATSIVIKDVIKQLDLKEYQLFKKSFFRKNIKIQILKTENIYNQLKQTILKIKEPIIIYTNSRKNTIHFSNYLNKNGFKSTFYHGGLPQDLKSKSQSSWMTEKTQIIVATNAFGMGIDKSNVRAVIHLNIPFSIENYIQEIGRAGRDGKKSYATLIYNNSTIFESNLFIDKSIADPKYCKLIYSRLHENYQIGASELFEKSYEFNLQEFTSKYNLPILKTYTALNYLENEDVLIFKKNSTIHSRLKFIVNKSQLENYEQRNTKLNKVIKTILRNYGGVFEQFITINEYEIAKKLNKTKIELIFLLEKLDKDHIIKYQKSSNQTTIKFLMPREDNFVMHQISKHIKIRNKIKISKSKSVIDFIKNDKICRNLQLLNYFGESDLNKCNVCDVCLNEQKVNTYENLELIAEQILLMFNDHLQLEINQILNQLPFKKNNIIKTIQLLIEKNAIIVTSQNKFEKVK